ncbi:transcriptional regulator, effector binding domain protein [Leptotrichia wadei]|uniref:Transcriptional regulator, effector binding domain protein n=1 Tax=Leptotrichia wadei TaxID=157687 RepID=A0A134AEX4_9FUSO|nr:AraC family transcriptional regulator [Leptotrichia wadei]KXB66239.1 transcriptional regulator, effector binding domain protein [Leptotrichia wadei]
MIKAFNETMKYIEETLTGRIDVRKIALLSGYSYPLFSRMFSIMVDYPLSEYIRFRKLSCAAIDLRETDEKIIEIAFKYGYESQDSFSLAFKKFHGHTPKEVIKGSAFQIFSPIRLSLSVEGGKNMDIKIMKKSAFKIAGVAERVEEGGDFPNVWDKLFKKVSEEKLESLGNGQSYGACYEIEKNEKENPESKYTVSYMAGYDVQNIDKAKDLGLSILEVPEAEYAVVKLKGIVPNCIHKGWKYVTGMFFPEQSYRHAGTPDFEVYSEGDMYSPNYEMELWVPIVKDRN